MSEKQLVSFRSVQRLATSPHPGTGKASLEGTTIESPDDAALRARLSHALAELQKEQQGRSEGVMVSVQDDLASLLQSRLLEDPPPGPIEQIAAPRSGGVDVFEVKFDERDIFGWLGSLFTWVQGLRKEPWLPPPATPAPLGANGAARVALLGDWGTGLYGAPACAGSIAADTGGFDLVMHLGDVYYSGTETEARQRFLQFWPAVRAAHTPGGTAVSRTLNGNHEMYTGGAGYFKVMLQAFDQPSSCCAFETSHWLLVGLDSAYEDHDLTHDQVAWLDGLLARAEQNGQRVILFSHHQPFSLLDRQGPKLVGKVSRALSERRIFAWFWGHEHRCVLYDPHPLWGVRGRCIGHGGYPYFRDAVSNLPQGPGATWRRLSPANLVPGAIILDARNDYITGEEDKYGANGYVTLAFDGAKAHELVHAPDGAVLYDAPLV